MSEYTNRSIRILGGGLPDASLTSTRAFAGASSAETILTTHVVGTPDNIRVELGTPGREGAHPIRWPSRGEIATISQSTRRLRALTGSTSRAPVEPRVPGLLVVPQATSDGELRRFFNKYLVHLADAGGTLLTWLPIGDPAQQDRIFREQLSTATESDLKALVAEFEIGVKCAGTEEHYIDGEGLDILKALGLPQRVLPAIFFLAPAPVTAWAMLSLDVAMFVDPVVERSLANHLIEDLAQGKLADYARGGGFTATRMVSLQRYLDSVAQEIYKGTSALIESRDEVASGKGTEPAAYRQPAVPVGTYAIAYGPGGDWRPLSKEEYKQQRAQFDDVNYFIDAIARKCYKRVDSAKRHQMKPCTVTQMHLISEMMLRPGRHRPYMLRSGASSDAESAHRMAQSAIFKAEEVEGEKRVRLFFYHKGAAAGEHRYEFDPPAHVSWRLVVPVV